MAHDCCNSRKNPKNNKSKKGVDTFLVGIVAFTLLALGGIVYLGIKIGATPQVATDQQTSINVDQLQHDWGTINMNDGVVSKTFAIENQGETTLKLYNTKTSCMCTTAQLKTANQVSKKFGMHEKSANIFEVQPGETAELLVEFDPAFHGPSGVGPISRTVTLNTNDSSHQTLSFKLTANVVKE